MFRQLVSKQHVYAITYDIRVHQQQMSLLVLYIASHFALLSLRAAEVSQGLDHELWGLVCDAMWNPAECTYRAIAYWQHLHHNHDLQCNIAL